MRSVTRKAKLWGCCFKRHLHLGDFHLVHRIYTLYSPTPGLTNRPLLWQFWIPGMLSSQPKKKCAHDLNGWRGGAYEDPRPQARCHRRQQSCSVLLYRTQGKINFAVLRSADCHLRVLPAPRPLLLLQVRMAEATFVINRSNRRSQRRARVLQG